MVVRRGVAATGRRPVGGGGEGRDPSLGHAVHFYIVDIFFKKEYGLYKYISATKVSYHNAPLDYKPEWLGPILDSLGLS